MCDDTVLLRCGHPTICNTPCICGVIGILISQLRLSTCALTCVLYMLLAMLSHSCTVAAAYSTWQLRHAEGGFYTLAGGWADLWAPRA